MQASAVLDLKAFVPSKDYELSIQFYKDLGFKLNWQGDGVAEFQVGAYRFLLQKFHVEQHSANFMMHLMVENTESWWAHITAIDLPGKYPGITAKAPAMQPWGLRVLFLSDPTGVLWHFADRVGK
ncbi:VOC family protein [Telmatocola sphagniphila]|uniref:VOC family protein n=1 Tax=Telmatocola sphagniphila TaxID=1123043 RepID=A0A8E6EV37_9BACT|nr:VOC family protein [Telmatocola sphagniphila]QVL32092.1 VOC family protein [Telmatocola sphagniphila]